jgi:hypothetical protein
MVCIGQISTGIVKVKDKVKLALLIS